MRLSALDLACSLEDCVTEVLVEMLQHKSVVERFQEAGATIAKASSNRRRGVSISTSSSPCFLCSRGAAASGEWPGCDFVEVTAGWTTPNFKPRYDPYFVTSYSDRIRNECDIPTLVGGSITTTDRVNTIVGGGRADLCVFRPRA